jgi:arylsulfatase A-like enzyme
MMRVERCRSPLKRFANLVAVGVVASWLAACSHHAVKVASLLDQIPEEQPAGPWRVLIPATDMLSLLGNSRGFGVDGRVIVQTDSVSSVRISAPIRSGETVCLRIARGDGTAPEGPEVRVQARLVSGRIVLTASATRSLQTSVGYSLRCPAEGADAVELRYFTKPGAILPGNVIAALAAAPGTTDNDHERATTLLRYRAGPVGQADALVSRRFTVQFGGCTKDAMALVAPDSWICSVPQGPPRRLLRFWISGIRVEPGSGVALAVEADVSGRWQEVGRWAGESFVPDAWRAAEVGELEGHPWRRLRFSLAGRDGVVLLGEPVLLPQTDSQSNKSNLILVDLDTMRADKLGSYGYAARPTSARLDSLLGAKGFFLFRNAHSGAPTTTQATAKFLTSRYFLPAARATDFPRSYTTLAEMLRAEGYYCAGFTGGGPLRFPGFEQGFHEYYWDPGLGKVEQVFTPAKRWLRNAGVRPFFLFVHTYESHEPYLRDTFCRGLPRGRLGDISKGERLLREQEGGSRLRFGPTFDPTEEERTYVQAAYDGGVHRACEATADLFGVLDGLGLWESTIVVVLSDHGEEFWDHSDAFASHPRGSVYGEVLNVPFLIHTPQRPSGGLKMVRAQVSTVDLVPTVADLLGLTPSDGVEGASLVPLMQGGTIQRATPLLASNSLALHEGMKVCAYADDAKYIIPVDTVVPSRYADLYPWEEELFVLSEDPGEKHNVVRSQGELALQMSALVARGLELTLKDSVGSWGQDTLAQTIPPDLHEQLRTLGYVD